MTKKTNSIDKMAEQFTSPEEQKAYSDAQYKTILNLNKQVHDLQLQIDKLNSDKAKLTHELSMSKVQDKAENKYNVTDEETVCVIQIAMLKNLALERELITDEVKRLEIYVKTLGLIRGKSNDAPKEKDTSKMSTEDLLSWMEDSKNEKQ